MSRMRLANEEVMRKYEAAQRDKQIYDDDVIHQRREAETLAERRSNADEVTRQERLAARTRKLATTHEWDQEREMRDDNRYEPSASRDDQNTFAYHRPNRFQKDLEDLEDTGNQAVVLLVSPTPKDGERAEPRVRNSHGWIPDEIGDELRALKFGSAPQSAEAFKSSDLQDKEPRDRVQVRPRKTVPDDLPLTPTISSRTGQIYQRPLISGRDEEDDWELDRSQLRRSEMTVDHHDQEERSPRGKNRQEDLNEYESLLKRMRELESQLKIDDGSGPARTEDGKAFSPGYGIRNATSPTQKLPPEEALIGPNGTVHRMYPAPSPIAPPLNATSGWVDGDTADDHQVDDKGADHDPAPEGDGGRGSNPPNDSREDSAPAGDGGWGSNPPNDSREDSAPADDGGWGPNPSNGSREESAPADDGGWGPKTSNGL
ncbi:MAG: hypothetical protein TREMPRED_005679, partial [Tremellales sp. Tagirdzhanova-0007]